MLVELRVSNLGVIEDQTILLGPGLTALTGETGAGKTLLVDAISLLTGGPADPSLVAPGAGEARVEGRFAPDGGGTEDGPADEIVLSRVVPAQGRSRCYLDGSMISVTRLAELGRALVDIHGQNAHQSLLSTVAQREALDRAGQIDTAEVRALRRALRRLADQRAGLGGDPRERARQIDLLSYQLEEIDRAGLEDPDEDTALQREEELLADAVGLTETARAAWEALAAEDGIIDRVGATVSATGSRPALGELHGRLAGLQDQLADAAAEARQLAEAVEEDPERLAAIGERRRILTELRRKYGGSLDEVIAYGAELRLQVEELGSHDRRAAAIDAELDRTTATLAAASERLWAARRQAAPDLAAAVEKELQALAMPRARFSIQVGDEPGDESVTWMLGANPGQPMLPLAKVASGGELARAMLASRLVMGPAGRAPTSGRSRPPGGHEDAGDHEDAGGDGNLMGGTDPGTLIFDEVDAGIGGEAAVAVGRALAAVGADHQVLVVTHLAQVAAFATSHLVVAKDVVGRGGEERTVATAGPVSGEDRVVELARMLSGRPDSRSARQHAAELLSGAGSTPDPSPTAGQRRR